MKHFYFLALLAFVAADASAQSIDLKGQSNLRRHRLESQMTPSRLAESPMLKAPAAADAVKLAFVTLAEGYSLSDLEEAGVKVTKTLGNTIIAEIPLNEYETVAALDCVKSLRMERPLKGNIDVARQEQHIDDIHFGTEASGLPQAYTGQGVIAGLVDQGVDPHHINFRYANGDYRVSYLAWLRYNKAGTGMAEDHYNYTNLQDFTTDDASAYHGTHTMGIMAGSYNGDVTVAKPWADPNVPETPVMETKTNPYYGVAPEADLAVSCGELTDAFLAYGVDYLLGYADYMQWPMVINMSVGSNSGPHDPNSQMAQFLDLAGQEAIICMAAGNEGDLKIGLNKTFTADDKQIKTFIYPYVYQYSEEDPETSTVRYGSVEVWSEDDTPFELKAVIYNKSRGYRAAYNMPAANEGVGTYYCSSSDYQVDSTDIVGNPTLAKAYDGYVGVGCKLDEETGRYYGLVDYYVTNTEENLDENYILGFEVTGQEGKRIDCYCDGYFTWMDSYGVEGFDDGNCNGSISDMAVANNIIVVGSYNTRDSWPCLDGGTNRYPTMTPGYISPFSSYGTLADGRNLPTVCAPGAAIVSSVSWFYARQLDPEYLDSYCTAKVTHEDGRIDYWKQELGTSMSTPFVSGSIALWLQANPNLTVDDVKEIIAKTAVEDDQVKEGDPVQWGAGKFNALEGLKEAIRRSGVNSIADDIRNDHLFVTPGNEGRNSYTVFLGTEPALAIDVFSAEGMKVMSKHADADETTINLDGLNAGIYILNVNGRHSAKVAVK